MQLPMLRTELRKLGQAGLAEQAQMWEGEAAAYQHTRAEAIQMLVDSRREAGFPPREIVEEAWRMAPDLPFALTALGTFAAADGDLDRAETVYHLALETPSSGAYYDALLGLAQLSWAREDLAAAGQLASEARAWNPYLAGAYLLLSELDRVRGDEAGARRALEEGLRMNPHHGELEQRLAGDAAPR
jgi:tetratricopeptide (TPR) repeat protein